MSSIYRVRGMLPYLIAMFMNAFVDLGHKIVIQNTIFKIYDGHLQVMLTAIVNGLILLPYIVLFSPAGFLSDRFAKQNVMRASAGVAVALTLAITAAYYLGAFEIAFAMTLLLGMQAAIYSPAKYGYLKPLVGKDRLAVGNGVVQAVTIVAILAGTFAFSIVFELWFDRLGAGDPAAVVRAIAPLGWVLVACSALEFYMTLRLPALEHGDAALRFSRRDYVRGRALRDNLAPLRNNRTIRLSIIGLAVFWAVSQVMLAAFPAFAKEALAIHNTVLVQGMLAASGVGIVIGSVLAGVFSKRHIETGLIPVGALGIALGLLWLPGLQSVGAHALNFLFIGAMGGLFIVPLNALIQFHATEHEMGKVLAANNLVQNIAMLGFLVITALVAVQGLPTRWLLVMIAMVAIIGTGYTVFHMPQSLVRFVLSYAMTRRYRVRVQGFKNIPESGGVLLLGNHISWIDWAVVQIACPRPVRFVMLKNLYERWYLRWLLKMFGVVPISQGGGAAGALDTVATLLMQGEVVCLFPEGSISRNGHLGEFRPGFERVCVNVDDSVRIVPFYLRGLWGSQFSRANGRLKKARKAGLRRDIIVAFGKPQPKSIGVDVLKRRVLDLSVTSWQEYVAELPSIADAFVDGAKRAGFGLALVSDTLPRPFSGIRTLAAVFALARRMRKHPEQHIGILLPASTGGAIANMAALVAGKTVVNLNYTASAEAVEHALQKAGVYTVYTVKKFLERLGNKGSPLAGPLLAHQNLEFVDEILTGVSKTEWLTRWLLAALLPARVLRFLFVNRIDPNSTAAILFSSGSEGLPKGVMLTHRNILANVYQVADVVNMGDEDVVFGSLPLFHAFGLTVTTLMPLIEGAPLVCHADPTDAIGSAKAIAEYRATFLCATSTFLRLYTKHPRVHPLVLQSLRVAIAGAEKLSDDVRNAFKLKFHVDVLEGYGATETTPVSCCNLPDQLDTSYWQVQQGNKVGTVGMPLPGTSCMIVDPVTLEELPTGEDGLILIGGCQVMRGYLEDPERTANAIVELDGLRWYKTGDKGHLDRDGFLTIVDRYSRFAKLGGEMVSLSAVEQTLRQLLAQPELDLVATALPDEKKGERVVVLIAGQIDAAALQKQILSAGINPLLIPAEIYLTESVPKLGSGKTDFAAAKRVALELSAAVA